MCVEASREGILLYVGVCPQDPTDRSGLVICKRVTQRASTSSYPV